MPDLNFLKALEALLHALNDLSPLALVVLLGGLIALVVHKSSPLRVIKDNHLTHIELHLKQIAENSEQQLKKLDKLDAIHSDLQWVKGKID